jgi:hypothetical protein
MKRRTTEEVIREITKFLNGIGGAYDWDDFLTIPIHDRRLDAIRLECLDLRDTYPPGKKRQYCSDEGLKRLEEILHDLKTKAAGEGSDRPGISR